MSYASASRKIILLSGLATQVAPTVTDGTLGAKIAYPDGRPIHCDQAIILVKNTAGSGTITASPRIWGWQTEDARWYDLGPLNGGTAIPETSLADTVSYAEPIAGLRAFHRLYCELASAGTTPLFTVQAIILSAGPVTLS